MTHKEVQNIARSTMNYIHSIIKVGMSLSELRSIAENKKVNPNQLPVMSKKFGLYPFGAPSGTRTRDPLIKSQLLYQLS